MWALASYLVTDFITLYINEGKVRYNLENYAVQIENSQHMKVLQKAETVDDGSK